MSSRQYPQTSPKPQAPQYSPPRVVNSERQRSGKDAFFGADFQGKEGGGASFSENGTADGAAPPRGRSGNTARSEKSGISAMFDAFVPKSIYNTDTKKVFGFLTAEDLLIVALIFLFAENTENRDPLLIPALIYILLSDYIDLPELSL